MTRISVFGRHFPALEPPFPVLERLFFCFGTPFSCFGTSFSCFFVLLGRLFCPGTGQRSLSRDICSCPCPGTRIFLSRDKGTKGQWDVPSLGNPKSKHTVLNNKRLLMVRDYAFWVVRAARAATKISFLLTYPTFEDAVFNFQGQNKIRLLKSI